MPTSVPDEAPRRIDAIVVIAPKQQFREPEIRDYPSAW
jgi:hypothetical protein